MSTIVTMNPVTTEQQKEKATMKEAVKEYANMLKLINVNNGEYILKYTSGGIEFADIYSISVDEETGEKCINIAHKMGDLSDIPF